MPLRRVFFVATWLLLAPLLAAETWYESYHEAEQALDREGWSEAVQRLNDALEERPESVAQARTYGMRFVAYFPYLKLGIAYYHLGLSDAALSAFETEERQGEIDGSPEHKKTLETYRNLIHQERMEAVEEQQRRAREVVTQNLQDAVDFENEGRLDDALSALARVLAVQPEHAQAAVARQRILAAIAGQQRQNDLDLRFDRLRAEGGSELDAGRFGQAAATLSRALEIRSDSATQALLDRAQQGLKAEIEAQQNAVERDDLIELSLARAAELEAGGDLVGALKEALSALALEPRSSRAITLKERILHSQAALEDKARREDTLQLLLTEAQELLAAGEHEQALRRANRALALEPSNAEALRCTAQVYAQLSTVLLLTDNAAPVILIDEPSGGEKGDSGIVTLRSPALVLTGTVFDNSPVELRLADGTGTMAGVEVLEREVLGTWITSFRVVHELAPGLLTVAVVATDEGGQTTEQTLSVDYAVPFVRSLWFPASLVAALGLFSVGVVGRRAQRRRRLLRRRFNPYIAGAPILGEQYFFGRQRLLDYVLRRIANNSILLYGERRIGKTSFQHQLKRCLSNLDDPVHDFYPVFIDLQGTPQEKFFATVAADIFQELGPLLDGVEPDPSIDGDAYGYRELVKDLHKILKALVATSDKKVKVVLLIDEVDELNDYDPRINQKLRSLFMRTFAENLVSVVSGVAIKKHWEREGSPWYNFFQEVEVEALDDEAARALIEQPVRGVLKFEEGVLDEILRSTNRRPYQIQKLCSELIDRMHEQSLRTITLADVASASQALESH